MLWQACKLLSKLRSGTKKSGFDAVICSTDRPRMKYCEDQKRNDYLHSCRPRTQPWFHNQSIFYIDTVELDRTHSTQHFFQREINPQTWRVGSRIKFEKHETSLFLLTSDSAKSVIKTAQAKQSPRSWTRWSLLQVKFFRKEPPDFNHAGRDSWRQNWLAHIRPTWRTSNSERETNKSLSHFKFDEANLQVSPQIDDDQRFDQEVFTEECRNIDY